MTNDSPPDDNPWLATRTTSGDAYDARYDADAAAGKDVHGEANFVQSYGVRSVLDAGCGTGRVGRELARRGFDVVGVDLDEEMLATARRRAPGVDWRLDDLATVDLGRAFDAAVAAGNVMIFLSPGSEAAVIANVARHLAPGGLLIAGFQLLAERVGAGVLARAGRMTLARYDALCADAGLALHERFATWEKAPWREGGDYAVSVHRREGQA
jgi:SAM-dependent methyltransferase